MSCILRAYGKEFKVDDFAKTTDLPITEIKRRGDLIRPSGQPYGPRHQSSALHLKLSDAKSADFAQQVDDALRFLRDHAIELSRLTNFSGLETATLDLSIAPRGPLLQCCTLPANLLRQAAALNLEIELSIQPSVNGETGG